VPLLCVVLASLASAAQPRPLIHAHAHNDYTHARPLLDALDCGFCSIEADIWLVAGKLLVGHDRADLKPQRTFQALYLDPLKQRVQANGGRVYPNGPTVQLLVDVKTEAESTYVALERVLAEYASMLTRFEKGRMTAGAVMVVISGNRVREKMAGESVRYAACDGLIEDIEAAPPVDLVPLVSSRWGITFKWNGRGEMPEKERAVLRQLVEKAHRNGQRLRFWGAPDNPAAWKELRAAGVDLLNTDRLGDVRRMLNGERVGTQVGGDCGGKGVLRGWACGRGFKDAARRDE